MSSTATLERRPREHSDAAARSELVTWSSPEPGLWVLNHGHSFGGTIDRQGHRFALTGSRNEPLGRHATLTDAQQALLTHTRTTSQIGQTA